MTMNVIDYMIRFEEDGLHLYEALACDSSEPEMRTTYNLLADSQRTHLRELMDLRENKGAIPADSMLVEKAGCHETVFRRLLDSRDIHAELKLDPDGIGHILAAEEDYIRMLEGMGKAEPAGDTKTLLERMVEDEREHLERIVSIYDFIKAPHTYLEWGEFSNLHTL